MLRLTAEQTPAGETNEGKELFHLSSCIQLFHFSQIDNHPAKPGEQSCEMRERESYTLQFLCFIFISSFFIALCVTNIKSLPLVKSAVLQSNLLPEVRMTQRLLIDKRRDQTFRSHSSGCPPHPLTPSFAFSSHPRHSTFSSSSLVIVTWLLPEHRWIPPLLRRWDVEEKAAYQQD